MKINGVAFLRSAVSLAALLPFAMPEVQADKARNPINKVAIILDASASYRARQEEALRHALDLLEQKRADTKLSRWDHDVDQIAIISLDAMPDLLWEGTAQDLKREGIQNLAARFKARTDYASCTDVGAAFRVAAKFLEGDPALVRPAIIAYSDLIDEKPAGSLSKCRKLQMVATDFPWDALRNTSVNVLWLPPDQKLVWQRAAHEHGWTEAHLFTVSESAQADIKLAGKAVLSPELVKAHAAEKWSGLWAFVSRSFNKAGTFVGSVFRWLAIGAGLFVGAAVLVRVRKRSRRTAVQQFPRA